MDFNFIDPKSIPALESFSSVLREVNTLEDKIRQADEKCNVLYRSLVRHRQFINRMFEAILRSVSSEKPYRSLTTELISSINDFNNKINVRL